MPVGKYNILKVTDTLPEGLKYIDGSIVVYKGNTQNKAVEGKDYTVTVTVSYTHLLVISGDFLMFSIAMVEEHFTFHILQQYWF